MISKDTDSPPPDKKTPEVPIKKKERKNGTNFPTEEAPVKAATGASTATGTATAIGAATKFEKPRRY